MFVGGIDAIFSALRMNEEYWKVGDSYDEVKIVAISPMYYIDNGWRIELVVNVDDTLHKVGFYGNSWDRGEYKYGGIVTKKTKTIEVYE